MRWAGNQACEMKSFNAEGQFPWGDGAVWEGAMLPHRGRVPLAAPLMLAWPASFYPWFTWSVRLVYSTGLQSYRKTLLIPGCVPGFPSAHMWAWGSQCRARVTLEALWSHGKLWREF